MDNDELKQEFATLREDIKQGFAEQDARIDQKFVEKFAGQDVRIDRKFAEQDVRIDRKFAEQDVRIDRKFAEQEEKISGKIRSEIAELVETSITPQFEDLCGQIAKIRSEMVTKSYLDDKLADFEGGMVSVLRKEDNKVNKLLKLLEAKSILSSEEMQTFNECQVFSRLQAV